MYADKSAGDTMYGGKARRMHIHKKRQDIIFLFFLIIAIEMIYKSNGKER
jgi:hypothetical protein